MSQDLFEAFGTAPPSRPQPQDVWSPTRDDFRDKSPEIWDSTAGNTFENAGQPANADFTISEDDDFGDFEDASVSTAPKTQSKSISTSKLSNSSLTRQKQDHKSFPPKAVPKPSKPLPFKLAEKEERIGQHPFAGHMDFLFDDGDDDYDAGTDELGDLSTNPEAAMAFSKKLIAEQQAAQAKKSSPAPASSNSNILKDTTTRIPATQKPNARDVTLPKDPDVLFDADNLSEHEEDDFGDFGDFESDAKPTTEDSSKPSRGSNQSSMPALDLLGLDDPLKTISGAQNNSTPSGPAISRKSPIVHTSTKTVQHDDDVEEEEDKDAWDDFEDAPPREQTSTRQAETSRSPVLSAPPRSTIVQPKSENTLPPTDIPPPIILLSIFPTLFASADDALFNTMTKLDLKQRQALLAHPASHQFLKAYIGHCTVLAHIIAGRKLRWKRDQHLSQGMRIGPAAAGGKGGMKLTGLDKSELAKEEQEVVDVLRLWKAQVGKLRTAVTAASSAPANPRLPNVPDIAEQMPVKTLKQVEGGYPALYACALCGLKREERVAKVDVGIDDSFGEWWVQSMNMHLACRNFWDEFEKKLKSR